MATPSRHKLNAEQLAEYRRDILEQDKARRTEMQAKYAAWKAEQARVKVEWEKKRAERERLEAEQDAAWERAAEERAAERKRRRLEQQGIDEAEEARFKAQQEADIAEANERWKAAQATPHCDAVIEEEQSALAEGA